MVPPVERFSTAILKYRDAVGKYFPGEKLDYVSLEGYWAANVLIEGVRRTGRLRDEARDRGAVRSSQRNLRFGHARFLAHATSSR